MSDRSSSIGFRFLGVFFLGAFVSLCGCKQQVKPAVGPGDTDSNNLKHVKCRQYLGGGAVEIPVNSTSNAIGRDDQIVFVCKGELVHWSSAADSNVASFTVAFKNNVWPFGTTPATLSSGSNGLTTDQTVAGATGKYAECYEYNITVKRKDGTTIMVDPHVIPMGP
jgi:hypothetical protein